MGALRPEVADTLGAGGTSNPELTNSGAGN